MAGQGGARWVLWIGAGLAACLWIALANGGPLYYFDTAGYIDQGMVALRQIGLVPPAATGPDAVAGAAAAGQSTVDGSRSVVYALLSALLSWLGALDGMMLLNAVAVVLALWLPVRVAVREGWLSGGSARATALPLIVASLGSLPFYVAYLMPDIFAAVLLLVVATLAAFGPRMRPGELALALGLGAFAVVSHLSHLAIATLMLPVAAIAAPAVSRRRWWIAPLALALIVAAGIAEQKAFRVAAKALDDAEVIVKPYITARLIQDGPGLDYLDRHCPDPAIATCRLWEALQRSDNPRRLTATHIVFEASPDLGSFRLMSPADQALVASRQVGFFLDVLRDSPIATTLAFARNTAIQTGMVSIDMTLPTAEIDRANAGISGGWSGALDSARLRADAPWLGPLT